MPESRQALNQYFFPIVILLVILIAVKKRIKIVITNKIKIFYITMPPSTVKTWPVT